MRTGWWVAMMLVIARVALADLPPEAPPDGVAVAAADLSVTRPVVDIGRHVTETERATVASELVRLREATGIQMAVVMVDSTTPRSIETFAQGVFDRWRGGSVQRNDGILLVWAIRDRKSRLHLGTGIEAILTNQEAQQILDDVRPLLRAGAYAAASSTVIADLAARFAHIVPGGPLSRPPVAFGVGSAWHLILLLLIGLAAGVLWERGRTRDQASRRWYDRGWAALAGIVVGGAIVYVIYRGGPAGGYACAFGLAIAFGILASGAVRAGVFGTIFMGLVLGLPLGIPLIAITSAAMPEAWSFGSTGAAHGTAVIVSSLLGLFTAIMAPIPAMAARAGRSGSSYSSGSSYESSSYSSSSSSYGSSSSGGSDWSGGGGSSSGGGATSSW